LENSPTRRTAQRGHAIAGVKIGQFGQNDKSRFHGFTVQYTSNIMSGKRGRFPPSGQGKLHKHCVYDPAGNFAKRVSIKEKERRGAMALKQKVQRFAEGQDLGVGGFPALSDPLMSFGVISKLSFSSFTRSSVEVGDKLPVPVFDKSGSAL